jgi:1-acyl-sn-glycerol-3-phosphate acyltransferase
VTGVGMSFEAIRPYTDDEVPAVLERLARDEGLVRAAASFAAPSLNRWCGPLVRAVIGWRIRGYLRPVRSVAQFQQLLARAFAWLVEETTDGFTYSGTEALDPAVRYLFVSNHRDIALDSAFLNYALHLAGHTTTRIAFGDNLLATGYAADIMRLNKGFVVNRSAKVGKAAFAAMLETSQFIRHSIESGESVWIAQREGRAKDGCDRTDAAIIKMFALAYRKEVDDLSEVVARLGIVPVAISYEYDPCDAAKAKELAVKAAGGTYEKAPGEDLRSVTTGVLGHKGRVHLHFGAPLSGTFADAEAVAAEIDRQIVAGYRLFPSHLWAAVQSGVEGVEGPPSLPPMQRRVDACPAELHDSLLLQYANPVRRARRFL